MEFSSNFAIKVLKEDMWNVCSTSSWFTELVFNFVQRINMIVENSSKNVQNKEYRAFSQKRNKKTSILVREHCH